MSRDRVSGRVVVVLAHIYPLPYGQRLTSNTLVSRDRVSGRVVMVARIDPLPYGQRLTLSTLVSRDRVSGRVVLLAPLRRRVVDGPRHRR